MNCNNCGYEIKKDEKICSNCGNLLLTQQNEYLYFDKQQKYGRNVLIFELVFSLLNVQMILSMPIIILLSIIGIVLSTIGIINANKVIKISKNPMVMSIIGLIVSVLNIVVYVVITIIITIIFMIIFAFFYIFE